MGHQSLLGQTVDRYGVLPRRVVNAGVPPAQVQQVGVATAYQSQARLTQPPSGKHSHAKPISSRRHRAEWVLRDGVAQ
jgi:hypothetical protein